jgi:hypothetical protein
MPAKDTTVAIALSNGYRLSTSSLQRLTAIEASHTQQQQHTKSLQAIYSVLQLSTATRSKLTRSVAGVKLPGRRLVRVKILPQNSQKLQKYPCLRESLKR